MLEHHWYPIASSSELKNVPFACSFFGKKIVLFRNGENKPVAMSDICPHRNAPLSLGKVKDGALQCHYHGWSFGEKGNIINIPSLLDQSKIPPKCVQTFHTMESEETIWISLQDNVKGLPSWGALEGYSYFFELLNIVNAPIDLIIENFVDCAHTPYVHQGLFRSPGEQVVEAVIKNTETGVHIETLGEAGQKSLLGKVFMGSGGTVHTDEFIFPTTVQVDYLWGIKHLRTISICTPIDSEKTKIFTRIYLKNFFMSQMLGLFLKTVTKKILAQDKIVLERQAKTIALQDGAKFMGVASDGPIAFVRRAYLDYAIGKRELKNEKETRVKYRI
jgi:phenylpropionate dioxygenase-like ring-hydroxylating dioxygenase large terminal subunit